MTSLIRDGHLQTCLEGVHYKPFFLGSYFKPQLSTNFMLFPLIFQSIIKFIMEKEDLNYFRASIFFQNSLVSAATS